MKKRTTIEMTLLQCPTCGSYGYADPETGLCPSCGSSMTVSESFTREEEDGIMPDAAPVQYPILKSTAKGKRTFTVNDKIILFTISFGSLLCALLLLVSAGAENALIMLCVWVVFVLSYGLIFRADQYKYDRIKERGQSVKGVILGYNIVGRVVTNSKGSYEEVTVQMQVFAKIKNKDMIIFVTAPDGVSSLSHPRGTEVTLYGYDTEYIVEV